MAPFSPMVNLDGLSNQYTDNLYQYDPRPTCSRSRPNRCGSKYLFCDLSHGNPHCASKIVVGGRCGGYTNNEDRCYLGRCVNNICIMVSRPNTESFNLTTTPAVPMEENCFNEAQCCSTWARNGDCERNPSYMHSSCRASCGICKPTTYDLNTECSNRHIGCVSRRDRGECDSNRSWMMENCRDACGACGLTRLEACNGGGELLPSRK
ncbi:hypothetical protein KIN20_023544 [Parelaphostrongylus tenuis]|uniref:ShKT domain-containing protein n=1 Tax=Parelaphostrongylus tenuis TaxID=148309 RepID=A0AAD5N954_PARTN|nr:hypothetical protein KIN20_023544 [Parelaphostrongylus tenuis]